MAPVDANKTFTMISRTPFGLVLDARQKPSAKPVVNKAGAAGPRTDPREQVKESSARSPFQVVKTSGSRVTASGT